MDQRVCSGIKRAVAYSLVSLLVGKCGKVRVCIKLTVVLARRFLALEELVHASDAQY